MKRLTILLTLLTVPFAAHSTILKYEFEFFAHTLGHDPEEYSVNGTGYIFADTELDAVIGGRFESPELMFGWSDPDPDPLQYFDAGYVDLIFGGDIEAMNEVNGEFGSLSLAFSLPHLQHTTGPYSTQLDSIIQANDYTSWLEFPLYDSVMDEWITTPLRTFLDIQAPVEVPEPSVFALLFLGLASIGLRRFTNTKS